MGVGAKEAYNVVVADEDDALLVFFKFVSELRQERDVDSWIFLIRFYEVEFWSILRAHDVFKLEIQDLSVLLWNDVGELFGIIEESFTGLEDLSLVDTPAFAKLVHDVHFIIHDIDSSF